MANDEKRNSAVLPLSSSFVVLVLVPVLDPDSLRSENEDEENAISAPEFSSENDE